MTPARFVDEGASVYHGTRWALRCPCGVTRATGVTLEAVRADLIRRHRIASPACRHLAGLERR